MWVFSNGLQFFVNCSSMGPFHGVQSFKNRLLPWASFCQKTRSCMCSYLRVAASVRSSLQHGISMGCSLLQGTSTCVGVVSCMGRRVEIALTEGDMGCRKTTCFTVVFSMGRRRISVLVESSPLTLVCAILFLSHFLTHNFCIVFFSQFLEYIFTKAPPASLMGSDLANSGSVLGLIGTVSV